jgi:hypothetical protein
LTALENATECHVWTTSGFGTLSASVGERATFQAMGGSLEGTWSSETQLRVEGTMVKVDGTYESQQVVIDGPLGDLVAALAFPNARIDGVTDVTLTANRACSERQLALGTAVLMVAIASQ